MFYLHGLMIAALMYCVTRNENPLRFYAAYCVLVVMAVNVGLFYTSFYNAEVGLLGFHVYQSLFELGLILLLALRPSKLGILMIGVSISAIFVNIFSYWIDFYGDSTTFFEVCMYSLLLIQIALLLSRRLTDGTYRTLGCIAGLSVFRAASNSGHQRATEGEGK
jgi:hypothetical protein